MTVLRKDTFWTIVYRGWYIHGHYERGVFAGIPFNREVIRITDPDNLTSRRAANVRAAKWLITHEQSKPGK